MERTDEDSMESGEEVDIIDIAKKIPFKVFAFAMLGFIIALLIIASHNYGYGNGYKYVQDYYEDYINNSCMCFNRSETTWYIPTEDIELENTISRSN